MVASDEIFVALGGPYPPKERYGLPPPGGTWHNLFRLSSRCFKENRQPMSRVLAAALFALLIGGCAQSHLNASGFSLGDDIRIAPLGAAAIPDAEQELMFSILAGEMAAQWGDFMAASDYYLSAARLSLDPRIAERATRLALFARHRERAWQAAERWLLLQPNSVEAQQIAVVLMIDHGQPEQATQRLAEILDHLDPEDGYRVLVALLVQADEPEAALKALEGLQTLRPDQPAAWQALADLAFRFEYYLTARDAARAGLERFPDAVGLRLTLARALSELEDSSAALEALAAAVEAHPERREVRLAYARALLELDDYDQARYEFDRMLVWVPEDPQLLLTIGLLSLESEHLQLAEGYLRRLLATGERDSDAHYYLGRMHEMADDPAAALASYSLVSAGDWHEDARLRAARLTVDVHGLQAGLLRFGELQRDAEEELALRAYLAEAALLRERGDTERALVQLARALIQFPGQPDLLYMRGLVHERADDIAAAEADFRAILELEPENVSALNALGYTLADRTERYEEAYDLIVRAYAQRPDDAAIIDSYGWVLYRLGRLDEALTQLRLAYKLFPDGEIASNLAVVLWELGHYDESRAVLTEALSREPEHERLLRVQSRLFD